MLQELNPAVLLLQLYLVVEFLLGKSLGDSSDIRDLSAHQDNLRLNPIKSLFNDIKSLFNSIKTLLDSIQTLLDCTQPSLDSLETNIHPVKLRRDQRIDRLDDRCIYNSADLLQILFGQGHLYVPMNKNCTGILRLPKDKINRHAVQVVRRTLDRQRRPYIAYFHPLLLQSVPISDGHGTVLK